MNDALTQAAIEDVARNSYGRLVAYIAARSGDVAGAEDALGDAFVAALECWPSDGVPAKPEAWLLRAARNRMIDTARHYQVEQNSEEFLRQITGEAQSIADTKELFPDERLKLLFVCAHPAIDVAARTPLMLQTVLGIDAARIASAFLVSPTAMSQRLVRAKNKIRDAAIPFRVPEPSEWDERVSFVLDAIYSAYTTGWDSSTEADSTHHALAAEAIDIGCTLIQLMPTEPEAHGLLALMLHCEARCSARYTIRCLDRPMLPRVSRQDHPHLSLPRQPEQFRHLATTNLSGFVHDDDRAFGHFTLEKEIRHRGGRRKIRLFHVHNLLALRGQDDHTSAGFGMFSFESYNLLEKLQAKQRRLTTLPRKNNLFACHAVNVLKHSTSNLVPLAVTRNATPIFDLTRHHTNWIPMCRVLPTEHAAGERGRMKGVKSLRWGDLIGLLRRALNQMIAVFVLSVGT